MRPLVLNTRPKNQANVFSVLLNQAGFDVLEIPALEINKLNFVSLVVDALVRLEPNDLVVFTSANSAVAINEQPQIVELLKSFKIAAVGNKTASILRQSGMTVHLQSVHGSSEDLAELIAKEGPKVVLYLSGIPNTGRLKEKLSTVLDFIEIPIYTSSPSTSLRDDLVKHQAELKKVEYLSFLSIESMSAFDDALGRFKELLITKYCVVISQRVAECAETLGYQNISIAQARSVEAMVSELVSLSAGLG